MVVPCWFVRVDCDFVQGLIDKANKHITLFLQTKMQYSSHQNHGTIKLLLENEPYQHLFSAESSGNVVTTFWKSKGKKKRKKAFNKRPGNKLSISCIAHPLFLQKIIGDSTQLNLFGKTSYFIQFYKMKFVFFFPNVFYLAAIRSKRLKT